LWMAAAGHNFSVRRGDFEKGGGFYERLFINEHREIALRLFGNKVRLVPVPRARPHHPTHRVGWLDPLVERDWERVFYEAHPCLAVKLMPVFWKSLAGAPDIPVEARITSLPQLDAIVQGRASIPHDVLLKGPSYAGELCAL